MHCLVQPVSRRQISSANELKFLKTDSEPHLHIKYNTAMVNSLPLPQINSSAIHWAALQENTTTGYCYAVQPCQKAQPRQALMRAAGHSFSPGTQQCYCGSNSGRELADLFLHVGSELAVDGGNGRQ